jgi:hypothetical protein
MGTSNVYKLCLPDVETVIGMTETLVFEAIEEIIEELGDFLKSVIIYTGCQTRFLGLDFVGLLREIEQRYPVTAAHYEESDFPKTDGTPPTRPNPFECMLRLLPEQSEENSAREGVLLLNNSFSFDPSNELPKLLDQKLNLVGERNDDWYDLAALANTRLSLVTSTQMLSTAQMLEARQAVPYLYLPIDYRLESIANAYEKLGEVLGMVIDCQGASDVIRNEIDRTLHIVGSQPISLLLSGSERPWNLVRALIEYGFNIESVTVNEEDDPTESADADFKWITENRPGVEVHLEDPFEGRYDWGRRGHGGFRGGPVQNGAFRGDRGGFNGPPQGNRGNGSGRHGHGGNDMGQEETALWGYAALSALLQSLARASEDSEAGGRY